MDTYSKPIEERFDWLFKQAARYSAVFSSPEAYLARPRYRESQ